MVCIGTQQVSVFHQTFFLCFLLDGVENVSACSQPCFSLLVGKWREADDWNFMGEKKLADIKGRRKHIEDVNGWSNDSRRPIISVIFQAVVT